MYSLGYVREEAFLCIRSLENQRQGSHWKGWGVTESYFSLMGVQGHQLVPCHPPDPFPLIAIISYCQMQGPHAAQAYRFTVLVATGVNGSTAAFLREALQESVPLPSSASACLRHSSAPGCVLCHQVVDLTSSLMSALTSRPLWPCP